MARMEVHVATAAHRWAEEHPVAAETTAIPAADIRAAAPAETVEDIPAVAEVLAAEVEAVDIPVEEAVRPAEAVVEDILVAEGAEVPEAAEGMATKAQST